MRDTLIHGVLLALLIIIGVFVGRTFIDSPSPVQPAIQTPTPKLQLVPVAASIDEDEVWNRVQYWRTIHKKPVYKRNEVICKYARERVNTILTDYTHDKFKAMSIRLSNETGLMRVSENIAQGYTYPSDVLQGWIDSPSHKAALLANYTDSCIQCELTSCVQLFAAQ